MYNVFMNIKSFEKLVKIEAEAKNFCIKEGTSKSGDYA